MRSLVFLGDEDRAKEHAGEALTFAGSIPSDGFGGQVLSDGTRIDVSPGVITIESEFLADLIIFLPKVVQGSQYNIEMHGWSQRQDAMLPKGLIKVITTFEGTSNPTDLEFVYLSDGIMLIGATFPLTNPPHDWDKLGDPQYIVAGVSIAGGDEDVKFFGDGVGTVGAFPSISQGTPAVYPLQKYASAFSICTYGVDRSQQASPFYQFAIGTLYEYGPELEERFPINESGDWVSSTKIIYNECYNVVALFGAGKGLSPYWGTLALCSDVITHNAEWPGNYLVSSCPPVLIPLGNERILAVCRKRTPDGTKRFGGTFSLAAYIISGTNGGSAAEVSTLGLTSGFMPATWGYGDVLPLAQTSVSPDVTGGAYQCETLLRSMTHSSKLAAPLSHGETLVAALKELPVDAATTHEWACVSATVAGLSEKGVIVAYSTINPNDPPESYSYTLTGFVATSETDILAYLTRSRLQEVVVDGINSAVFVRESLVRFSSTNGGVSWDGGVDVADPQTQDTPPVVWENFSLSPAIYLGNGPDGAAIIAMGATRVTTGAGGTYSFNESAVWHSEDGGLTFKLSHTSQPELDYSLPETASLSNFARGLTSLQYFGNSDDGFAPSPYRHLPTYYGAPTKASR